MMVGAYGSYTFSDGFNRGDIGSDDWFIFDGRWYLSENTLSQNNHSSLTDGEGTVLPGPAYIVHTTALTSLVQAAQITFEYQYSTWSYIGPTIRGSDSAKTCYSFYTNSGNSVLRKLVDGSSTELDNAGQGTAAEGQLQRIEIDADNIIKTFVDGVERSTYEDIDDPLEGYFTGVMSHENTFQRGDDFYAESPINVPTPVNLTTTDITSSSAKLNWEAGA